MYFEAKLGSDDHAAARNFAEKLSQQLLIRIGTVDFCRIQEITAKSEIAVKNPERLFLVGRTVSERHAHAAQTERRNL
jgi:hypothetical protein